MIPNFEYNKKGDVYKCLDLDSIIRTNLIPNNIKEECKEKFNKDCYFNFNGVTKIGKLIGVEMNLKLNELFYILNDLESKDKYYITCIDTTLKRL